MLSTLTTGAKFVSREYRETTVCSPDYRKLCKHFNKGEAICNFTYENSGEPWYCGKPTDKHLLCEDWKEITLFSEKPALPLNDIDLKAFK